MDKKKFLSWMKENFVMNKSILSWIKKKFVMDKKEFCHG